MRNRIIARQAHDLAGHCEWLTMHRVELAAQRATHCLADAGIEALLYCCCIGQARVDDRCAAGSEGSVTKQPPQEIRNVARAASRWVVAAIADDDGLICASQRSITRFAF